MSQSDRIKGQTTDEVFQEPCFLWERRASVGADFDLCNIQDLLYAQQPTVYKTLKEMEMK